jgi:hypothetical protein
MIFAIGGTLALSVFNFNAAGRLRLEERTEASLIAHNILKTLALKHRTDTPLSGVGGSTWQYPAGHSYKPNQDVYPGHQDWFWAVVPAYPFSLSGTPPTPPVMPIAGANAQYSMPADAGNSIFEYGWCVVDDPQNVLKYLRLSENWTEYASPPVVTPGASDLSFLTVTVTWPRSETQKHERNRVTVSTVIPS